MLQENSEATEDVSLTSPVSIRSRDEEDTPMMRPLSSSSSYSVNPKNKKKNKEHGRFGS